MARSCLDSVSDDEWRGAGLESESFVVLPVVVRIVLRTQYSDCNNVKAGDKIGMSKALFEITVSCSGRPSNKLNNRHHRRAGRMQRSENESHKHVPSRALQSIKGDLGEVTEGNIAARQAARKGAAGTPEAECSVSLAGFCRLYRFGRSSASFGCA